MPIYRGKSTARIIRLLTIIIIFFLIAAAGANYAAESEGFDGHAVQGSFPGDGGQPLESSPAHDPVSLADVPASPLPEDKLLDSALPEPKPVSDCGLNPDSNHGVSSNLSPSMSEPIPPPSSEPAPTSSPEEPVTPTASQSATRSGAAPVVPLPVEKPVDATTGPAADKVVHEPGTAISPITLGPGCNRNLRMRIKVTNSGGDESREIRVEIPLLGTLSSPYQVVLQETFSHTPTAVDTLAQGSRVGHFYIDALAPGSSITLVIDYSVRVHPLIAHFDAYTGGPLSMSPGFLLPSSRIESDNPRIIARAADITSGKINDLEKARAIYGFVQQYLRYDLNSPHRNQGALSALENATGVCEDYAALFAALCRASGIPARQVNGYTDPRGIGEIFNTSLSLHGYRHSWAEFYLEGMGWLPADPAMGIGSPSVSYFGSLPGAGHIAQNYQDQPMRVKFTGGQLAVTWDELLFQ